MLSTSTADDIDVYVGDQSTASKGETLVVFTLDVRSDVLASETCTGTNDDGDNVCYDLFDEVYGDDSTSTDEAAEELDGHTSFLELLIAALRKVLSSLNSPDIKVALMVPHDDTQTGNEDCVGFLGDDVPCSNGAYVLSAFKSTGDDTSTPEDESLELEEFFTKLDSIPLKDDESITGTWSHDYQLKELFFEMYRYLAAERVLNGQNGTEDYDTDDTYNIDDTLDTINTDPHNEDASNSSTLVAELSWDIDAQKSVGADKFYKDTLDTAEHCSQIFSVNLTKGTANKDDDSDSYIEADQPDGLGITLANSNFDSRIQVLEWLANNDLSDDLVGLQNITSYFIAKPTGGSGGTTGRADDWAQAGGTGSAFVASDDPDELVETLSGLFTEIVGVSTTFVAASVPANVFNRAETLNEVFLAIFEPDESNAPLWPGNVKKLTTTTIEETISCEDLDGDGIEDPDECETEERKILVDVFGNDAINPQDGRIRPGALTYWTRTGTDDEYLPAPTTEEEEQEFSEGTDGRKVTRGAAGQVKPGYLPESGYSPGDTNDSGSNTDITGPRKLLTEPDDPLVDTLVDLDAESLSNSTAEELLTDSRPYPGGNGITYGDYLYQTVMEDDCSTCTDYSEESAFQDTAELRVSNLIRFARGWDVDLDTVLSTTLDTAGKRPWWQADPLHNRPLALNYGARSGYTADRPDIRIIVGGNDGQVQMIRDGRKSDDSEDGVESWSFLPREFVPLQKRLLQGSVGVYAPGYPSETDGGHEPKHPYAMDGAPTALVVDNDLDGTIETADNDQVYVFFGQRRGGKKYYALDVSDPDNPEFLWSIGKDDADGEFAELGQTWSLMRAGLMRVEQNDGSVKNRPVLIFSGGYNGDDEGDGADNDDDGFVVADDLGKDSRVPNAPGDDGVSGTEDDEIIGEDDDEGNALFIINALTGELIWKTAGPPTADSGGTEAYDEFNLTFEQPNLVDSVPASPTPLDSDGDGYIDRIYFADTGGNVWRVDAADPDRSAWDVNKIFEGGRHYQASNDDDRRFFNAPDVVLASDAAGNFDAVVLASGDRANPLATTVENWIYMIKDRNTTSGAAPDPDWPLTHADLADVTDNCVDTESCTSSVLSDLSDHGWKVQLNNCESEFGTTDDKCGEKSLSAPLTIEGTIFLTTYLPFLGVTSDPPETCGPEEGGGLFYAVDLQDAGAVLDFNPNNNTSTEDTPERFDKLRSPGIPPEVVAISPKEVLRPDLKIQKTPGRESSDTFWYERKFE